jgi:hypothetical protein
MGKDGQWQDKESLPHFLAYPYESLLILTICEQTKQGSLVKFANIGLFCIVTGYHEEFHHLFFYTQLKLCF